MKEAKMERCPNCNNILVKSYHVGFPAPVLLVCNKCKKEIKETKEIGRISFETVNKMLLGENEED